MMVKKIVTTAVAGVLAMSVAVAPAQAQVVPAATPSGNAQYAGAQNSPQPAEGSGSTATESVENEAVQAGLLLVAGVVVSLGLAAFAGIRGGAIPLPEVPGLPLT